MLIPNWVFFEAGSVSTVSRQAREQFVDQRGCDWAGSAVLLGEVVSGKEQRRFAEVMTGVRKAHRGAVRTLAEAIRPVDIQTMVNSFDPYRAAPSHGVFGATLGGLGQLLGGFWVPVVDGGWDAVAETADLSCVRARMKTDPSRQFAVRIGFEL